jgi:tetratricopeptide (TPR) repeat protein
MFKAYEVGGETGLRVLAAATVAAGSLLLFLACPNASGWLMTMAATSIASPFMDVSTYLFAWPLIGGFMYALQAFRQRSNWWALTFPFVLTAWAAANREAVVVTFLIGLAFLERSAVWLNDIRRGRIEKLDIKTDLLPVVSAFVLTLVVFLFVVPEGSRDLSSPIRTGLLMRETPVLEWAPASIEETPVVLVFAAAAGLFVGLRRWTQVFTEAIATAVSVILILISGHFVVYLTAVVTPSAARSLNEWVQQTSTVRTKWLRLLAHPLLFLILGVISVTPRVIQERERHTYESAVALLENETLAGPFFNVPETGGLLSWAMGPAEAPFTDLRPSSLAVYQQAFRDGLLTDSLHKEDVLSAILSWDFLQGHKDSFQPEERGLWLVYLDDAALIYARPEANSRVVEAMAFRHYNPMVEPQDYSQETVPEVSRELFSYFQRYPTSARALATLAPILLREGRNEEALEMFEAARLLKPDDPNIWKNLSELYLFKGMYGLAEQASRRGMEVGRDEDFVLYLGNALYGQGRFPEAIGWFEKVLKREPDNLSALRAMVDIHERLESPESASHHRQRLELLESARLESLLEEAELAKERLDFLGAAMAYRAAHDIAPADEDILWSLVVALLIDSRHDDAVQGLKVMVRQNPENSLAHLTLGSLCANQVECEPDEARQHLETFLLLSPTDLNADLARRELARLPRKR